MSPIKFCAHGFGDLFRQAAKGGRAGRYLLDCHGFMHLLLHSLA
jgi:hypothetical protein